MPDDIKPGDSLVTKQGCHIRTFVVERVDGMFVNLKSACLRFVMTVSVGRYRELKEWSDRAKESLERIEMEQGHELP